MSEDVRIKIRSVRFEVEASLFSDDDEYDGEYRELREAEPETVEINTVARLKREDGRIEISYDESDASGMEGSTTAVSFVPEQSGIVSMIREGTVSTVLVFEAGKRHHCLYNTPFMPFQVCVHTLKVDNSLLKNNHLELDYVVEIRGAQAERTKFSLELL